MRSILPLVLAILPALAAADTIHLADGTKREGRIVETTATEVVVDVGVGNVSLHVRIPRADVVRIEHKATANDRLMADFARRLTAARSADDWHALGAWCAEQRVLKEQARAAYERAIAADPDHAGARAALGHVQLNGAWMARKRAVALLAPELMEDTAKAREGELLAHKEAEQAKAQVAEAHKRVEELEAEVARLQHENEAMRVRLAAPPPPPPPPRVIYRPIIIRRTPPRRRPTTQGGADLRTGTPKPPATPPETPTPEKPKDEKGD